MENLPTVIPKLSSLRLFFLHRHIPDSSDLILCCGKEKSFSGALPELAKTTNDISWVPSETPIFSLEGNHEVGMVGPLSMGLKMCMDSSILYFLCGLTNSFFFGLFLSVSSSHDYVEKVKTLNAATYSIVELINSLSGRSRNFYLDVGVDIQLFRREIMINGERSLGQTFVVIPNASPTWLTLRNSWLISIAVGIIQHIQRRKNRVSTYVLNSYAEHHVWK